MISRSSKLWLALLLTLLPTPVASQGDPAVVQVVRVIDGDTIQVCCVFGDRVTVRYVGVDTPEMGFAQKIAHCILFMDERRIIEEGAPNTFFRYPRQGRARLFLRKIVVH